MQITAGKWRSRFIITDAAQKVRPTAAKVREAIFSILGNQVKAANVLDICCGTGILGLEALSRGAHHITFVDLNTKLVQQNIARLNCQSVVTVYKKDFRRLKKPPEDTGYDLIFLDPPYNRGMVENILSLIEERKLLNEKGYIISEHEKQLDISLQTIPFQIWKQKAYGDTMVTFWCLPPSCAEE